MAKKYLAKSRFSEGRGKSYEPGDEYEGDNPKSLLKQGLLCASGSDDEKDAKDVVNEAEEKAKLDKEREAVRAKGDSQAPKGAKSSKKSDKKQSDKKKSDKNKK